MRHSQHGESLNQECMFISSVQPLLQTFVPLITVSQWHAETQDGLQANCLLFVSSCNQNWNV
jgi:hypothetical protein